MRVSRTSFTTTGFLLLMLAAGTFAQATEGDSADWPCPQALVPEVPAATLWDGPSIDGLVWRDRPEVVALVERITPSQATPEAAEREVAGFANALPAQERDRTLTLVFAGVMETLNADRRHLLEGIQRYSRDQAQRADRIGKELDELVALERETAPESAAKAQALKARLEMEERIFDDRERSIRFLCLRPVAVEERLGVLARMIAGHLGG